MNTTTRTLMLACIVLLGITVVGRGPLVRAASDDGNVPQRLTELERRIEKLENAVGAGSRFVREFSLARRVHDLERAAEVRRRGADQPGDSQAVGDLKRATQTLRRGQDNLRETLTRLERDVRTVSDVSSTVRALQREINSLQRSLRGLERRVDRLERD
jgi:predicted  nucleic acid-binding Zn-ribbon protein